MLNYKLNEGTHLSPEFNNSEFFLSFPATIDSTYALISPLALGPYQLAIVDIDDDNDLDVFFPRRNSLLFFENSGTNTTPEFVSVVSNPFNLIVTEFVEDYRFLFKDIDQDYDYDFISGNGNLMIVYENIGNSNFPDFQNLGALPYNLDLLTLGWNYNSLGQFIDIDHDYDLDFINKHDSVFAFYENTGSSISNYISPIVNPFNLIESDGYYAYWQIGDFEGDGDFDILIRDFRNNFDYPELNFRHRILIDTTTHFDIDNDGFVDVLDCNDLDANIYPNAIETCDGIDNNCDGQVDEIFLKYYVDTDIDGFGVGNGSFYCSDPGIGFSLNNIDCNDINPNIHPNSIEICDSIDNNCNESIDEGLVFTYFEDNDNDGFGFGESINSCIDLGSGYTTNNLDCNDEDSLINPNAYDIINNWIDEDCSGLDHISYAKISESNLLTGKWLFPNPGNDKIFIETKYFMGDCNVRIISALGTELLKIESNDMSLLEINTSKLKSGIYYVEISSLENRKIMKWVKK